MAEIDSEGELTRSEVADFLREFADELDEGRFDGYGETRREEFARERGEGLAGEGGEESSRERDEESAEEEAAEPRRITLIVGGDSATVTVPEAVDFDVGVESRSPMFGSGVSQRIEFDLSWEIEDPDELGEDWLEVE